jgi:hypothetical protein
MKTYILREHLTENCRPYTSDIILRHNGSQWTVSGRGNLSVGGYIEMLTDAQAEARIEAWRGAPAAYEENYRAARAVWEKVNQGIYSVLQQIPFCPPNPIEFIEFESGAYDAMLNAIEAARNTHGHARLRAFNAKEFVLQASGSFTKHVYAYVNGAWTLQTTK